MDFAVAPAARWRRAFGPGAVAILLLSSQSTATVDQQALTAMETFLARPAIAHQYIASRRLEASGSGRRAWLDVQTEFTHESGLRYEVTAEGGSGYIRGRILRSLLDEEQKVIARGGGARVALTTDNYEFAPEGVNEEGLAVVGMRPLRRDRSLIAGRMFLTVDGDLIRVEGRLARNPSFWVSRVNVVRSYQRINGALMPVALHTTAQLRLLGSSALEMTYQYSHIDDQPVNAPDAEPLSAPVDQPASAPGDQPASTAPTDPVGTAAPGDAPAQLQR
jgi:hypothetical protein